MSLFGKAFDARSPFHRRGCRCEAHPVGTAPVAPALLKSPPPGGERHLAGLVETAVLRALFPHAPTRRGFLRVLGAPAAMAAIAQFFPLAAASEAFAQAGNPQTGAAPASKPEKPSLRIAYLPTTCATPLLVGAVTGIFPKLGLKVELVKVADWVTMRDGARNRRFDAMHTLAPMPLALTLGVGARPEPYTVPVMSGTNGLSLALAMKHRFRRDPKQWTGFQLAVPSRYSMDAYLLRYYLADKGVDPDFDVRIRTMPPHEMVRQLTAGDIDGFFASDLIGQRAAYEGVGFLHLLSKEVWDGHPCCALAVPRDFVTRYPNTFAALVKSLLAADAVAGQADNRGPVAKAIAGPDYLDQPAPVVQQVLTGMFSNGIGDIRVVPDRIGFDPFPWEAFAVWILTQMKRWGQLKGTPDYQSVAREVFLATDAARLMREAAMTPPAPGKKFSVMGKPFDPAQPGEYVASFPIRRI